MTVPGETDRIDYAVTCRTCNKNVWQGNVAPADGQTVLTQFAESVAGTACPSGVNPCPNKPAALAAARQQAVPALLARIAALEAKVKP